MMETFGKRNDPREIKSFGRKLRIAHHCKSDKFVREAERLTGS